MKLGFELVTPESTESNEAVFRRHSESIVPVGLSVSEEDNDLPYLYWTPKLHKTPFKNRFIELVLVNVKLKVY